MDIANSFRDNLMVEDHYTIEQISDKGKILTATRPGSVDTGK